MQHSIEDLFHSIRLAVKRVVNMGCKSKSRRGDDSRHGAIRQR